MRAARLKQKMSQMDLYEATGLDRTFISDLERGVQTPSLTTVLRVAHGVRIDPCELLRETIRSPLFALPKARKRVFQSEE
jgi:transcriptional regulator with XRE-family HTH domain